MNVKLTDDVRHVLERSTITETSVQLPPEQLPNYKAVNAVLEAAGGKWNKKARCHIFPSDPREALGLALQTGQIIHQEKARKKERQAFYTPDDLAHTVAIFASVVGHRVLEPSAGHGALAQACLHAGALLTCCYEIDEEAVAALQKAGFLAIAADFLTVTPPKLENDLFERIVMNPPFTRKSDAKHVQHAFTHWLQNGGLLTAIVADDGHDRPDLAAIHSSYRVVLRNEAGAFKESGTMIATLVIQLTK
jgi:predicted RNA methylase